MNSLQAHYVSAGSLNLIFLKLDHVTAGAYLNSLQAYYVPTGALRILFLKPDYVPAGALRIYSPEYDTKGRKLMTGNFAILSHF